MQNYQTQHKASEQLKDRYPYDQADFTSKIDPQQVAEAFGNRSIPKYAAVLANSSVEHSDCLQALTEVVNLLSSQEKKKMAIKNDLVPTCAKLLEQESDEIKDGAGKVLASLALDMEARKQIMDPEILGNIDSMLLCTSSEDVVESAVLILKNISLFRDGISIITNFEPFISHVVNLLQQPRQSIRYHAFTLLAHVSKATAGAALAFEAGILPSLIETLGSTKGNSHEVLVSAVTIIGNLAAQEHGKSECVDSRAIEVIGNVLTWYLTPQRFQGDAQKVVDMSRCCTSALLSLSTSEDAKPTIVLFAAEPLVACLTSKDATVQKNAKSTLNYVCESPLGYPKVVPLLLNHTQLLLDTLGWRIASTLNELLVDETKIEQRQAVMNGIVHLTYTKEGIDAITQCLHMIDRVGDLAKNRVPGLQSSARIILKAIRESNSVNAKRVEKVLLQNKMTVDDISRDEKSYES